MTPPLSERLRAAITAKGVSQRKLARLIAGEAADERRVENERRQLGKYLSGQVSPNLAKARLLAQLLDQPDDYFVTERRARPIPELVGEVYELLADVNDLIEERLGEPADRPPKEPPWAATIRGLLEELAGRVDRMAAATADSLSRLEAAIEAQSAEQPSRASQGPA